MERWALQLAALPDDQVRELLAALPSALKARTLYDWSAIGRPQQQPPLGDWRFWVIFPGRGWGKSKTGSHVVSQWAESGEPGTHRIALVGATAADVRDVMVEGETGILACYPKSGRPVYKKSQRCVEWPSTGAQAFCYSAEDPEQLRGPQHGKAWCDELAAWPHGKREEAWRQLRLGLRLGRRPQALVTTTPKAIEIIKDLVAKGSAPGSRIVVTRGSTYDNILSLPDDYIDDISSEFAGTRFGRQEVYGEVLEPEGALFRPEWFRYIPEAPSGGRTVVAVDPAITRDNDETGIVVVRRVGEKGYVLADLSGHHSPEEWSRRAIDAYRKYGAACIVAETNKGGEMVRTTIKHVDRSAVVEEVKAPGQRGGGKDTRAEPVAALYELGRIFHVGKFQALEDQMTSWDPTKRDVNGKTRGKSPDRMDALVWGISKLGFHVGALRRPSLSDEPALPSEF